MNPRDYVFPLGKGDYIRGDRPQVDCILCAVVRKDPVVENLMVAESDLLGVCINLYPYNSGHLLLFPKRHVLDIRELSPGENRELWSATNLFLDIVEELYHPKGFNLGYNLGESSGASIPHLHMQLIPRYHNEVGMVDLIGGARVVIEDPKVTQQRIAELFARWKEEGRAGTEGLMNVGGAHEIS